MEKHGTWTHAGDSVADVVGSRTPHGHSAGSNRLSGLGVGLLILGAVATPWNGVQLEGVQPGDAFLAIAVAILLIEALRRGTPLALPWWLSVLAAVVMLIAVSRALDGVDPQYLAHRVHIAGYGVGDARPRVTGNAVNAARWGIALVALPLAASLASSGRPELPRRLATAWMLGAAISAGVALSDALGFTTINAVLMPHQDISGRQAGLTSQPNNVAVAAAMAMPVAVFWALRGRRALGLLSAAILLAGTWVSGSRGGAAATVFAALLALSLSETGRRWLCRAVVGLMVFSPLIVAGLTRAWPAAQESLRLGGDDPTASASDAGRLRLARQAMEDFHEEPLTGIGLSVITDAHSIYLQVLAAGGIVLFLAFAAFLMGAVRCGVTLWRQTGDRLAVLLGVSIIVWAGVGVVENQLTDRYLYVPAACLAALGARFRRGGWCLAPMDERPTLDEPSPPSARRVQA